jgi:Zn-dependent protease
LFIASILLHEISHAVVGRSQGISVSRIDLFLFGGLAHMDNEPPSPKAEFWMAIVGPLVSIAIGVLATVAGTLFANFDLRNFNLDDPVAAMQAIGPAATLLLWLGPINIVLGLFNMVPGFPLDGGRVLRSLLWATTKDRLKATRWASAAGQAFAWILMGIGVLYIFGGALASGIWLLLIGWFLNNAARMSYEQLLVRTALHDVPVSRVMRTQIVTVPPETKVETLVQKHFMATDQHAFPVVYDHDLVGLVCMNDVGLRNHDTHGRALYSEPERKRRAGSRGASAPRHRPDSDPRWPAHPRPRASQRHREMDSTARSPQLERAV